MTHTSAIPKLPKDFKDNLNKSILLTGAGFSSYFCDFLAKDVANKIHNNVKNDKIKKTNCR